MRKKKYKHLAICMKYAREMAEGVRISCEEQQQGCKRFLDDLKNPDYDFRPEPAEWIINFIEATVCHQQAEMPDGTPLRGKPLILMDFHVFIVYNLMGFYKHGTNERRFKEAFIYIPRKNGKTTFAAALAWALGFYYRRSCSKIYVVAAAAAQSKETFNFLKYNVKNIDESGDFRVIDNNNERSISVDFGDEGAVSINALASNPDKQDSFNCNIVIADEMHAYKSPKQYEILKEATKAYTNKLVIGITTAGDNMVSFCYRKLTYCKKILDKTVKDDQYFVFICKAPEDEKGNVDYTNPDVHRMANPAYGVTIRPEDIQDASQQALNDPQLRKNFLAKQLNVYTAAMTAYFNLKEFRNSDSRYLWSVEDIPKLPVEWFGGTDLSKLHDLTAACLVGLYKNHHTDETGKQHDVLLIFSHCWFPIVAATQKAEEDGIPLFGWKDDGWLDMCNSETVNHAEIVNWYVKQRERKVKITQIGHDRKFCREYFIGMRAAKFNIYDQPQYFYKKSEGFRYIEEKAKSGDLYYF